MEGNMLLDKIKNYWVEVAIQDETYPEMIHIRAYDLTELKKCTCGGNLTCRDRGDKPKQILDYDIYEKKVLNISLFRKRFFCPTCGKSFTADEWINYIRRTKEFERYIALEMLLGSDYGFWESMKHKKLHWSNEAFAQRYGYKKDTFSNIVKSYAPFLTPLFIPPNGYDTFCLYPFHYNLKKAFYLLASKTGKDSMLLAVFGYNDGFSELKVYLNLHKDVFHGILESTIYTSFDSELIIFLRGYFKTIIVINELFLKQRYEFRNILKNKNINKTTLKNIDYPFETLHNMITCKKDDICRDDFEYWWNSLSEYDNDKDSEFTSLLSDVWTEINYCMDEILRGLEAKGPSMKELFDCKYSVDKTIENFGSSRSDFRVMAAKMLLQSEKNFLNLHGRIFIYTSEIFTDNDKWLYFSSKDWNSDEKFKGHCFSEVLFDLFNNTDILSLMRDNL